MRFLTHGGRFVLFVGLALGLVTACSGDGGPGGTPSLKDGGKSTAAAPKAYDPPLKFQQQPAYDIAGGAGQGSWFIELKDTTAYAISREEVRAVSLLDGKRLWSVKPQGQPTRNITYGTDDNGRPHFVEVGGQTAVLAAFSVTEPGTGTTPDRPLIELTAVAADSGKRLWTTTVERPEGKEESELYIAGADATTAVLTFGDDTHAVTVGVSLATRKTAWTDKGFYASFVDSGIAIGRGGANSLIGGSTTVEGRKLADGTKAWTYKDRLTRTKLSLVGGGLFTAVVDVPFESDTGVAALLSTSTGKQPARLLATKALGHLTDLSCWSGEGAVVCEADKGLDKQVVALDPENWTKLWSIAEDDKTRLMPDISTVFHTAVYCSTENGSVILDARTGKDKVADGGDPPSAVNEYAGLFRPSLIDPIQAHRAAG